MSIYAYISEDCTRDAQKHSQSLKLKSLHKSVTDTQTLAGFSGFPPSRFLKKSLGHSYRLIAYQTSVSDDQLILFLQILPRGSYEYEDFLRNYSHDIERIEKKLKIPKQNELEKIRDELSKTSPAQSLLPSPTDEEEKWLYGIQSGGMFEEEDIILETEDWVEKIKSPDNLPFMGTYRNILDKMISNGDIRSSKNNYNYQICWDESKESGIAYLFRPDLKRILLLRPIRNNDDIESLKKSYRENVQRLGDNTDQLSRIAARSYPSLMVLDAKAWVAIQKDDEANLALSPEEAELVENIRNPLIDLGYPLFINGRAGSGKSTILQYLAADYVDFALRNSLEGLLYMTCSSDLLKRAKQTVTRRLTAGHAILYEGEKHSQTSISDLLDHSFRVFHNFLRELLPREKQEILMEDRYVDYAKFKHLWQENFAKNPKASQLSVTVSWHVIRSYIKGIRSEQSDDLAPEEFESLPRRSRSVSIEVYKRIYSDVWSGWYQSLCQKQGYWDDQDIASLVLESGAARNSNYTAIFCDEAQDFTPIELDIIFQLSVFSRRSLQSEQLKCVPFIFAGDPLQTISPTGFQWPAVKANFHERFNAVLDPRRIHQNLEMSYRELHFNYRSNPGIVKFCNLIQFLRASLGSNDQISPQEAWRVDDPAPIGWFVVDNDKTSEQLRQNPGLVKLVYCEDGEETDCVERDTILQNALINTKDEGVYPNVLGPSRAKGLEFSSVVLFCFGKNAPGTFKQWVEGRIDLSDSEERLPLEYFFNRLYVAASRAKKHLIIVDSKEAIDNFWSFATARDFPENLKKLTVKPKGIEQWLEKVANIFHGGKKAWIGEDIDLHELAKTYEGQGRSNRDPYLMRQAGSAYRIANQLSKANECFAVAEEFEGKYRKAGNRYSDIGEYKEAFRCYWESEDWQRLTDVAAKDHSLTQRLQSRAASFMKSSKIPDRIFLDQLNSAVIEDFLWLNSACDDPIWGKVITEIAHRLSGVSDTVNEIPWAQVDKTFNRFIDRGISIEDLHLAVIAYANRDFEKAVNLWERSGNTQTNEYYRAKAQVSPFPKCILFFGRCRDYIKVLEHWRIENLNQSAIEKIEKEVIQTVIDAAIQLKKFQIAADLLLSHPERSRAIKLLSESLQSRKNDNFACLAATTITRTLVQSGQWKDALDAAESGKLPDIKPSIARQLQKRKAKNSVLKAVVWELAVSESSDGQQAIRDFLREKFIRKNDGRDTQATRFPNNHNIPPNVIGAAIERAGRIVDALQYYEDLMERTARQDVKKFAAERLIYNLELHVGMLKNEGRKQQQERRAKSMRREFNISDSAALQKYPIIRAPKEKDFLSIDPKKKQFPLECLVPVLSPHGDKLRIENKDLFQTVTIDGKSRNLRTGDVDFVDLGSLGKGAKGWKIPEWQNATISLMPDLLVRIDFEGHSHEVQLVVDFLVD